MTTFKDDQLGISFTYGQNDSFQSGVQQNLFQCQILPQGKNPQFDSFGMILVETNPQLKDMTFQDYMNVSIENLKNFPDPNLIVQNVESTKLTFAGYEAEKISYTMSAKNDTSGRKMTINSTVVLNNGKGYVFQVSGPDHSFDGTAMDYVFNTVKIY